MEVWVVSFPLFYLRYTNSMWIPVFPRHFDVFVWCYNNICCSDYGTVNNGVDLVERSDVFLLKQFGSAASCMIGGELLKKTMTSRSYQPLIYNATIGDGKDETGQVEALSRSTVAPSQRTRENDCARSTPLFAAHGKMPSCHDKTPTRSGCRQITAWPN